MKKKWILIIVGLSILGLLVYILFFEAQLSKEIRNNSISDRGKKFLQDTNQGNALEQPKEAIPQTITQDECFKITIYLSIVNQREVGECAWHYQLTSPKSTLTISTRKVTITTLDDEPGVRLRRERNTQYQEKKESVLDRTFTSFSKKAGAYEKTVFLLQKDVLFTLTLKGYSSKNLDAEVIKMLSSLEI